MIKFQNQWNRVNLRGFLKALRRGESLNGRWNISEVFLPMGVKSMIINTYKIYKDERTYPTKCLKTKMLGCFQVFCILKWFSPLPYNFLYDWPSHLFWKVNLVYCSFLALPLHVLIHWIWLNSQFDKNCFCLACMSNVHISLLYLSSLLIVNISYY